VERIRGELGGVQLARREATQLRGDLVRADAGDVEDRRPVRKGDRGRAGGRRGAAARRLEAGGGDALALDPQRDRDEVAFPWGNSRCSLKPAALTRRV
jgi:hypothetical protein